MRKFECREEPCSTYHPWATCNLIMSSWLTSPLLSSPPLWHGFSWPFVTLVMLSSLSSPWIWPQLSKFGLAAWRPYRNPTRIITSSYCAPRQCHGCRFALLHIVCSVYHAVGLTACSKSRHDCSLNKSKFISCLHKSLVSIDALPYEAGRVPDSCLFDPEVVTSLIFI